MQSATAPVQPQAAFPSTYYLREVARRERRADLWCAAELAEGGDRPIRICLRQLAEDLGVQERTASRQLRASPDLVLVAGTGHQVSQVGWSAEVLHSFCTADVHRTHPRGAPGEQPSAPHTPGRDPEPDPRESDHRPRESEGPAERRVGEVDRRAKDLPLPQVEAEPAQVAEAEEYAAALGEEAVSRYGARPALPAWTAVLLSLAALLDEQLSDEDRATGRTGLLAARWACWWAVLHGLQPGYNSRSFRWGPRVAENPMLMRRLTLLRPCAQRWRGSDVVDGPWQRAALGRVLVAAGTMRTWS